METPDVTFDKNVKSEEAEKRVLYVSGDLKLADLKAKAKKHNGTINDLFMGCMTKAIKDYYVKHKGQDLPQPHIRAETAMSCHLPTDLHSF